MYLDADMDRSQSGGGVSSAADRQGLGQRSPFEVESLAAGRGARLNFSAQGRRSGRCRVNRRAEQVSRPAIEKNRRRRVLVVTTCSPGPMHAAQRARFAPSPGLPARRRWRRNGKAAGSAFLGHPGESPRGRIHIMTIMRTKSGINKAEDAGTQTNQIHRCVAAGLAGGAGQLPNSVAGSARRPCTTEVQQYFDLRQRV